MLPWFKQKCLNNRSQFEPPPNFSNDKCSCSSGKAPTRSSNINWYNLPFGTYLPTYLPKCTYLSHTVMYLVTKPKANILRYTVELWIVTKSQNCDTKSCILPKYNFIISFLFRLLLQEVGNWHQQKSQLVPTIDILFLILFNCKGRKCIDYVILVISIKCFFKVEPT